MIGVTFKRVVGDDEKTASKGTISKEDQETLAYFQSLREAITESELLKVLEIICALSQDKESIATVLDLLGDEEVDDNTETSKAPSPDDFKMRGSY